MNNFNYGNNNMMGMNMGFNNNPIPQFDPYQEKLNRFNNLQQSQQQTQIQQKPSTNMNFVVVENLQKAKEQVVPCGYTMWMRDSSEPYQYIKSVDSIGTPTFTVLKVEDVTNEILNGKFQQEQTNPINYVSVEQYNQLQEKVMQLQESVNYYSTLLNQNTIEDKETNKKPTTTTRKVGDK